MAIDPIRGIVNNPQSINQYVYVLNNPIRYIDPFGLWDDEVHKDATEIWARKYLGFSEYFAIIIAVADNGIDSGETGAMPWETPGYHFNRAESNSRDTRLVYSDYHYANAVSMVNGAKSRYDMQEQNLMVRSNLRRTSVEYYRKLNELRKAYNKRIECALEELGKGLHPLQDYYAHGNIGVGTPLADHVAFGRTRFWDSLWEADNIHYDWKNEEKVGLVLSSTQSRYKETETATVDYLQKFLNDIGGLKSLEMKMLRSPEWIPGH